MSNFELYMNELNSAKNSLADISNQLEEFSRGVLWENLRLSGCRGMGVEAARNRMDQIIRNANEQVRNVQQLSRTVGTVGSYAKSAEMKAKMEQAGFSIGKAALIGNVAISFQMGNPRYTWKKLVSGGLGIAKKWVANPSLIRKNGNYYIVKGTTKQRMDAGLSNVKGTRYRKNSVAFKAAGLDKLTGVKGGMAKAFSSVKDAFKINLKDKSLVGRLGNIGKALSAVFIVKETVGNIKDNIKNKESVEKIVGDAVGDVSAGAAGVAIGAAIGSVIPGPGTFVGAAAGFVVGAAVGWIYEKYCKKIVKEFVSVGVQSTIKGVSKGIENSGKAIAKWFTENKFAFA